MKTVLWTAYALCMFALADYAAALPVMTDAQASAAGGFVGIVAIFGGVIGSAAVTASTGGED